jgi:hypothetical protein
MSIELLELAADALGDLIDEVVFVGGATVTLWITDPGAPPVRPTKDVDVVVEVATRTAFHEFESRLRTHRFSEDQEDGVICRWRHDGGLILDAMPSEPSILGFANRWQGAAIPHAIDRELPSSTVIRAVSPPYLLATKLSRAAATATSWGAATSPTSSRLSTVARSWSPRSCRRHLRWAPTSRLSSPACSAIRGLPTVCSVRCGRTLPAKHEPRRLSCRAFAP